jgi:hypothetical protein
VKEPYKLAIEKYARAFRRRFVGELHDKQIIINVNAWTFSSGSSRTLIVFILIRQQFVVRQGWRAGTHIVKLWPSHLQHAYGMRLTRALHFSILSLQREYVCTSVRSLVMDMRSLYFSAVDKCSRWQDLRFSRQ